MVPGLSLREMNGPNKALPHPYGSTVIPHNGLPQGPTPNAPKLPGAPSPIPGSLGVAGVPMISQLSAEPKAPTADPVMQAIANLLDAFADRVADKVVAKLAAQVTITTRAAGDVEDLNRLAPWPPISSMTDEELDALPISEGVPQGAPGPSPAVQMHIDLEQALREREHVKVERFAPGPLAFLVLLDGKQHVGPRRGAETDEVRTKAWIESYRTCTAYAQPYGQGYTDGAKPDEYVLLVDGKQIYRLDSRLATEEQAKPSRGRGYSTGLTFAEVLALVDGPLRSADFGRDS